jgi:hypothetical protein
MPGMAHMIKSHFTSSSGHRTALFKIEPSRLVDLIISKQTQYYTLWAVYTAVQFAAGNYGSNQRLPLSAGLAVLVGVWTFNLGHLGFVLRCVEQINKLSRALTAALQGRPQQYRDELAHAFEDMREGGLFWEFRKQKGERRSYLMNTSVHLIIDICASVALLTRVQGIWPVAMGGD